MATEPLEHDQNQPSLAEEIQQATRSVHAKLNKLIIDRLPLALPPRASSPSTYLSGLLHIAPIYITFEALWAKLTDVRHEGLAEQSQDVRKVHSGNQDPASDYQPQLDERIRKVLQRLRLPGLMRSSQLKADIQSLTGWSEHDVEKQLQTISQTGRLGEFVSHIKRTVDRRPHTLLAYSYVLFMALFAGGRIIRASLASAGDEFWDQVTLPPQFAIPQCTTSELNARRRVREGQSAHEKRACPYEPRAMPLRFFEIQTPMDGEDLKHEFKKRLRESEKVLTNKERQDVLQEAICIFDNMSLLVHQLDVVCLKQALDQGYHNERGDGTSTMLDHTVSTRLRDSVFVARERRAKTSSRRLSVSEDGICTLVQPKTSMNAGGSTNILPPANHPTVTLPGLTGVELCPAFSKSMRFEKAFLKASQVEDVSILPPRRTLVGSGGASVKPATSYKAATDRICGIHVRNWVIIAAFGVIILGALATGRTGMPSRIVLRLQ